MSEDNLAPVHVLPTPENGVEVYRSPYPFVRSTFTQYDEEGGYEVPTWKPGIEYDVRHSPVWTGEDVPDYFAVADGVGEIILTVVSRHKPGPKYPERVFYTRQWRNPDGKLFGNNKLHICSTQAFSRRKRGWFLDEAYEIRMPGSKQ